MMQPFNVMATFWVARDRLYRVYLDDDTLYFIRIGGQFAYAKVQPNPGLGLVGAIPGALAIAERILPPEEIAAFDQTPPRQLLGEHEHNMAVPLEAVASASIVPRRVLSGHGTHWGRWLLTLTDNAKWTFQFMKPDDMEVGIGVLPQVLGERLQVKVRWDEARNKFVSSS